MADKTAYTGNEVEHQLQARLPQWEQREGWIRRKYKTAGWSHTMLVVNAVAYLAEVAGHHPDLAVAYAEVVVKLQTHDAKGITEKDFALAQKIENHLVGEAADGGLVR